MEYPKYKIEVSKPSEIYEFVSVGIKGEIYKVVKFLPTDNPLLFNLALGDKTEVRILDNGEIDVLMDDTVKSENGERDMVLATVASIVDSYTAAYPEKWILFAGNTEIKTRLYRMAITKNYIELNKDFHIFGLICVNENFIRVPFDSKTNFLAFIIKRKI